MRADRLLRLALLLQARGRMTASELAAELEVTVRTIYRDLEALSAAGIPVYAEPGPGGGCQLVDGYRTPLGGLTRDESAALLVLGIPAPLRDLGLDTTVAAAHQRVRTAGGLSQRPVTVHLDMPRWFHAREDTSHLPTLATTIENRRRVEVVYGARGKSRAVAPLGLVNKAGAWYVVVDSAGRTMVLRVARITRLQPLQDTFTRPPDFDLPTFWDAWSADFQATRPRLDVRVRASAEAQVALPEVFGDGARTALDQAEPADERGWRELTLTFEHADAAAGRLLGFGGDIEVQSPISVRDRMIDLARAALARHTAT